LATTQEWQAACNERHRKRIFDGPHKSDLYLKLTKTKMKAPINTIIIDFKTTLIAQRQFHAIRREGDGGRT